MNVKDARDLLTSYVRARYGIVTIQSTEEPSVIREIVTVAEARKFEVVLWSIRKGFHTPTGEQVRTQPPGKDPQEAVDVIASLKKRALVVLLDFDPYLQDPVIVRHLREVTSELTRVQAKEAKTIILLSGTAKLPDQMKTEGAIIEWPLPGRDELDGVLTSLLAGLPDENRPDLSATKKDEAVQAALGLTVQQSTSVWSRSLVDTGTIEPARVATEKKLVIAQDNILEWVDSEFTLKDIGGLDIAKEWLLLRRSAFGPEARAYGIPAPKGCLVLGVPGTGKSMFAKAASTGLELPLVRLDMGRLFGGLVGQSEQNTRTALRTVGAIAPCILWID